MKYVVEDITFYIKCSKTDEKTITDWIKVQGETELKTSMFQAEIFVDSACVGIILCAKHEDSKCDFYVLFAMLCEPEIFMESAFCRVQLCQIHGKRFCLRRCN